MGTMHSVNSNGKILFPNRRCFDEDFSELWRKDADGNTLANAPPPFCGTTVFQNEHFVNPNMIRRAERRKGKNKKERDFGKEMLMRVIKNERMKRINKKAAQMVKR